MTKITLEHAEGRGKKYAALITGRDQKFKFARKFLNLASTGEKYNCYAKFETVDDIAPGSIVETMVANYKGKQTRTWLQVSTDGAREMTESQVYAAITI